ncbi:MAG: 30S ribosomal protein S1 [Planctomycetes bacterium]|nr:30S ribosomal protein S1 [Planctomycetota bacterium]
MADSRDLIQELSLPSDEIEKAVREALGESVDGDLAKTYEDSIRDFEVDTILRGRIINIIGDDVVVDIGYKSEGILQLGEFPMSVQPKIGDEVEVFLESVEDDAGSILISKNKADRIRGWERIISSNKEGDMVRGKVIRKIKGGLLVDIGVPVFLPASQVDIRRVEDIGEFVGREVECKIIKIDEKRMNIIVSRRKLLEEQRELMKKKLLTEIKEGDIRAGVVKNIADFGVFVDLGGIDGLLHITDMSWGRVSHPSEMIKIDSQIQVKILKIDRERERIALGLKQLTENPWTQVEKKYPVTTRVKGRVVNILPYGAFVELETGVEGLVHISEMSWTKRISHPSELVQIGDSVDVMVLNINREKQEISLGMKQTEVNPWTLIEQKYPQGTQISGKVRNLTNYGAFVEIEEGIDGLLHISDMSWTKKVLHPSEIVKKGDKIDAVILSVDPEKKRVALGLRQLTPNPWQTTIPEKYRPGTQVIGKVTKLTNFGAFVELEPNLEGLLHVSKLQQRDVHSPEDVLSIGDLVEVEVIRLEPNDGKIGLSMVRMVESKKKTAPPAAAASPAAPGAPAAPAAPAGAPAAPTTPPAAPPAS